MVPISPGTRKRIFILLLLLASAAFAGEGEGHSHGPGGDWKLIAIVLGVLVVIGIAFHFLAKKK